MEMTFGIFIGVFIGLAVGVPLHLHLTKKKDQALELMRNREIAATSARRSAEAELDQLRATT